MRKFLKKRLLGLPVAVLLVLALTVGVAATGYAFLSFTTTITVDEPLLVEYNLEGRYGGGDEWLPLGDEASLTVQGSAGDPFNIALRINNRASGSLWVTTVVTGDTEWFDITGLPDGSVPASDGVDIDSPEWQGMMTLKIKGNTPPNMKNEAGEGGYTVTLTFKRS